MVAPMAISPIELHRIKVALEDFYSEGEAEMWLNSEQKLLEGRKPIDCEASDVRRLIDQLNSGAYI